MSREELIRENKSLLARFEASQKESVIFKKESNKTILKLTDQIAQLQRMIYGRKSERFIPEPSNELNLFSHLSETTTTLDDDSTNQEEKKEESTLIAEHKRNKSKHKGRSLISTLSHLKVEEIHIESPTSENSIVIGKYVRETLAYTPGEFIIKREITKKYKNKDTGKISMGTLSAHPIPKCEADISLLTYICTSKFVDHLPEYRLQKIFKRDGVIIAPSTMNGWVHKTAELLKPMANHLGKKIKSTGIIQMDESTIKVMAGKKNRTHTGYMWVIYSAALRCVQFIYYQGRTLDSTNEILKSFAGKFQTDGYVNYTSIDMARSDLDHSCCNAHARRKFEKALANDKATATQAMKVYQKLYAIEKNIRTYVADHPPLQSGKALYDYRTEQRKEALPILTVYKAWLEEKSLTTSPASLIGKAMAYVLVRWQKLTKYATDGELEIDTNLIENTIRPLALGRKNYLFAGNHDAATNIGVFYSIFGTCRHLGINPSKYLQWYLSNIQTIKINEIQKLDPWHFRKSCDT